MRVHSLTVAIIKRLRVLAIAGALCSGSLTPSMAATPAAALTTAPDFALKSLTSDNLRLSEFRGQVVLLGFWARWCGDCRQAMQALQEIDAKYQRAGLVTLGIDVDDNPEKSRAMTTALGLRFPILIDENKQVSALYKVESMPLLILVDREGQIRYRQGGFETGDGVKLTDQLRQLLND